MKRLLLVFSICAFAASSAYSQDDTYYIDDQSTVTVQSQEAPPPLPDYVQPPCPYDGYIWTPGYWAWASTGYYWVAGVWVMPPSAGVLWTPGYWGFYSGHYGWHRGYWGEHIGYYGGVNYGFGYYGSGFYGGRWEGGHFRYNTAVWHVGRDFHNVYEDRSVIHRNKGNRASYNGPNGVKYRPTGGEQNYMRENHTPMTNEHMNHERNMGNERGQFYGNSPRPATHSMSAPGGQRFNQRGRTIQAPSAPRGGNDGGGEGRNGGGGHSGGGGGGHGGGGRH